MMVMTHWTIAFASALLMLSIGEVQGTNLRNGVSYESGVDNSEDGIFEVLEERRRLCYDDPYLKYLHFNANLGSTSFEDCEWVGADKPDRCILPATNGRIQNTVLDGTTPLQLKHLCPKACGECEPPLEAAAAAEEEEPPLEAAAAAEEEEELDREIYNPPTDDLTAQQIKELEIKLRRQKMNQKKKRKGKKPCPCPEGTPHGGNGGGGGDGSDPGDPTDPGGPIAAPVAAPTMAPLIPQTMVPTTDSTFSGSSSGTWTGSWSSTWTGTSTSTFVYTSEFTTTGTVGASWSGSFSGTDFTPDINAVISGQESSINKKEANKRLAITLSVIPLLLLLLVFYCLIRRMRASREGKAESDTDDSEGGDFPIHKTKSVDSAGSRFLRVLGYFNGRQDDSRCDVHHCTSATCEICANDTPKQVRSIDSYRDEYDRTKEERRKERYMVNEVEC